LKNSKTVKVTKEKRKKERKRSKEFNIEQKAKWKRKVEKCRAIN
jgi:hypothetical protein